LSDAKVALIDRREPRLARRAGQQRGDQQGARAAVRLATLKDDDPTAGFFDENGPLPW